MIQVTSIKPQYCDRCGADTSQCACGPLVPAPGSDIAHMTDEWIDAGEYSAQDLINLRDEVQRLRGLIADVARGLGQEKADYPTTWKYSKRLQGILAKCQNTQISDS